MHDIGLTNKCIVCRTNTFNWYSKFSLLPLTGRPSDEQEWSTTLEQCRVLHHQEPELSRLDYIIQNGFEFAHKGAVYNILSRGVVA